MQYVARVRQALDAKTVEQLKRLPIVCVADGTYVMAKDATLPDADGGGMDKTSPLPAGAPT